MGEGDQLVLRYGRSEYTVADSASSSSRRSLKLGTGESQAAWSSASHRPSRLVFHGGTGFSTPYLAAILGHT